MLGAQRLLQYPIRYQHIDSIRSKLDDIIQWLKNDHAIYLTGSMVGKTEIKISFYNFNGTRIDAITIPIEDWKPERFKFDLMLSPGTEVMRTEFGAIYRCPVFLTRALRITHTLFAGLDTGEREEITPFDDQEEVLKDLFLKSFAKRAGI